MLKDACESVNRADLAFTKAENVLNRENIGLQPVPKNTPAPNVRKGTSGSGGASGSGGDGNSGGVTSKATAPSPQEGA